MYSGEKTTHSENPIPSLTLEPDLAPEAELVVAEEVTLQEAPADAPALTAEEQKIVSDFAAKIDVENTNQIQIGRAHV